MGYHFHGRDGASFTDATLHADPDCPALDAPVRPLAESSAPEDGEYCGECTDAGDYDPWNEETKADLIDEGLCPWCNEYEGDHVGQHASSAHPDEWDDYKS